MKNESLQMLYELGREAGKLDGLLMAMTVLADAGYSEPYRVVETAMRNHARMAGDDAQTTA